MFNLRLLHFAPALAVCALALPVRAQQACTDPDVPCNGDETRSVVTDSDTFGPAFSQWDSEINVTVPRLMVDKVVLGPDDRLVQAEVTVSARVFGQLRVHNRDPLNQCTGTMNLGVEPLQVVSATPIANLTFQDIILGQSFNVNLAPCTQGVNCAVGQETYQPPVGQTVNVNPIVATQCIRITNPVELAKFVAAAPGEQLEFIHRSNDGSGFQGCAPVTFLSDPFAEVTVSVRYVICTFQCPDCDNDGVCDVDEPDCDEDGIPDDCEPDCDFDGIPDDCDNPEDCQCVMRHRRMPSSLLVYPEFDNRNGSLTLLTVTNTNCDQNQGPVDVEIVYIDERNCLEDNFTVRLTPCDTFTAVTSVQNPNMEQGYVYAFAKSTQTGQAISFNYLIGNLMAINGIQQFDWSVNPVAFKGVTGHRQPTDVDADGIRDLDGAEYWEVPERLLVPRFLGQDEFVPPCAEGGPCGGNPPMPGYASELVLLNLSGGAQFLSTIVFFQIYNDNEEPFSASWDFYCWDRVRLARINGAFTNEFLKYTNDDPNEILGASSRESGWFWIDGLSADSTAENIQNPAVYAFLIERVRNYYAADLPWEFCSQQNGDLLPTGPFGDPRPGFPAGKLGDNQ